MITAEQEASSGLCFETRLGREREGWRRAKKELTYWQHDVQSDRLG